MANRRRMGGNLGGRDRFFYGQNHAPVSPWQGGMPPGGTGGGGGPVGNVLNSLNQSVPQLTDSQAQLALALTSLLQPQQSQSHGGGPPSLLSLNVNPMNNRYQGGNFSGPDRYNRRFDFKSSDRYDKPGNRNRDFGRRPQNQNKFKNQQRNVNAPPSKKAKSPPKSSEGDSTNKPKEETAEAAGEEKREENSAENDEKKYKDEKTDGDVKEERKKGASYEGVPTGLLNCHICDKKMWDAESFEKHVLGRAHQQMFEMAEESYKLKCNMMRDSLKLYEDRKMIELERQKRVGRNVQRLKMQRSHCNMCDLEIFGNLIAHRKTEGHQRLKHFLHPRCAVCNKEFPNRIEWDHHKLSPEHLLNKAESLEKQKENQGEGPIIIDESHTNANIEIDLDNEDEDEQGFTADEPNNVITDLNAVDLKDAKNRIPAYTPNRAVGQSLITAVSGFYCKPCSQFFLTKKQSKVHVRSEDHYHRFLELLEEKIERAKKEAEEKSKKRPGDETEDGEQSKRPKTEEENDADGSKAYDPLEGFETCESADATMEEEKDDGESKDNTVVEDGADSVETAKPAEAAAEKAASPKKPTPGTGGKVRNGAGPRSSKRGRKN